MDLIKINPDKERVKSILEMVELIEEKMNRYNLDKFASLILADYYEIIKELITAVILLDGFKTLSHTDLIEYLKFNYRKFDEKEIDLIDKLRIYRNRITYEGFKMDSQYLRRNESDYKDIINKLKFVVKNKLKE